MAVFFAYAIQSAFKSHAVGHVAGFQAKSFCQRDRRQGAIAAPCRIFPAVDRARIAGKIDWNFLRQLLVWIAGETDFRGADLGVEIAVLEINRANLFGEEYVNR